MKGYILPVILLLFSLVSSVVIFRSLGFAQDKHFSLLADSFIRNDLFLSPFNLPQGDYADYKARQYSFYGPVPSILLIPPVLLFGKNFPQVTLSVISLVLSYVAIYFLSRKLSFSKPDSLMLANFFAFSTVMFFVGLVNISAYLAQAVGIVFALFALLEYFTKRRWIVIGILLALAGMTRVTLYGFVVFFVIELFRTQFLKRNFVKPLLFLIMPVIFSLLILGIYNNRRFHSPFETGYSYNITHSDWPLRENLKYGLFSVTHIPANLYLLLFSAPQPLREDGGGFVVRFPYLAVDGWGLSLLFMSPLFLYFLNFKKAPFSISAIIAIIALAIPSLMYFGLGFKQYGYRYSLDFLPLLFLLLLPAFGKKLSLGPKVLIVIGVFFNCAYMMSIFGMYPLFNFFK